MSLVPAELLTRFNLAVMTGDLGWLQKQANGHNPLDPSVRRQLSSQPLRNGHTPLIQSIRNGNEPMMEHLIEEWAAPLDHPDNPPVVVAIQFDRNSMLRSLCNYGANADCRQNGVPALHFAAAKQDAQQIEFLLTAPRAANVNATAYNQPHNTALFTVLYYYDQMLSAPRETAAEDYRKAHESLSALLKHGADPKQGAPGGTNALLYARYLSHQERRPGRAYDPFLLHLFEPWLNPEPALREASDVLTRIRGNVKKGQGPGGVN
jgi:hypothetical protein